VKQGIIQFAIIAFIIYIFISYVKWDFNIFLWHWADRLSHVVSALLIFLLIKIVNIDDDDDNL
jgi:hypothetical protein